MKRAAWLLVVVLCSATFLFAGEKKKSHEMTGWICNAKCVTQAAAKATCDQSCSEKDGDVVFVDAKGRVTKISNPEMAMPHAGKKVKMKAAMDDSGMLAIENISLYGGGG